MQVEDFKPTGGNTSVLAQVDDWVRVWVDVETGKTVPITEPKPAGDNWHEGRRETDTLDGYACSSWYFLRYLDPHNDAKAWDPARINHWMPVDYYNGADHAVAHLLYSRFWMRFFYKLGLVPTPEPFKRMMYNAYIMAPDGQKMSKSKGNVIDPMEIMDSGYGADALRVYEMFIATFFCRACVAAQLPGNSAVTPAQASGHFPATHAHGHKYFDADGVRHLRLRFMASHLQKYYFHVVFHRRMCRFYGRRYKSRPDHVAVQKLAQRTPPYHQIGRAHV